jgi:hypothetical protein
MEAYLRTAREVSETGEFKACKKETVVAGVPKPEKKSLLKRKSPSEASMASVPDLVKPVDAVLMQDIRVEAVSTVPCAIDNSPPPDLINLISDDDDFEALPLQPKKATLLSCKRRGA